MQTNKIALINNITKFAKDKIHTTPLWFWVLFFLLLRIADNNGWMMSYIMDDNTNILLMVFAAMYIAPIVAIFSIYDTRHFVAQVRVTNANLKCKVFKLFLLVIISLNSSSLVYFIAVSTVLSYQLFFVYDLLIKFSKKLPDDNLNFFKKELDNLKQEQEDFDKVVKYLKKIEPANKPLFGEQGKQHEFKLTLIGNPIYVYKDKFKRFLGYSYNKLITNKSKIKPIPFINWYVDTAQMNISIILLYTPNDDQTDKDRSKLRYKLDSELKKCFKMPPKRNIMDALKQYKNDLHLEMLSYMEKCEFDKVKNELAIAANFIENLDDKSYDFINEIIFKIKSSVKSATKFVDYNLLKDELLEFCVRLFTFCIRHKNNQYSQYYTEGVLRLVIECFRKNTSNDGYNQHRWKQRTIFIINFNKPTITFFNSYIKTLRVLIKEAIDDINEMDDSKFDQLRFAKSLLLILSKNLENNKILRLEHKERQIIIDHIQKTFIFVTALLIRDNKRENARDTDIETFMKKIDDESVILNITRLLDASMHEFNPFKFSTREEINEYGFYGMSDSYNPIEFYANFLKKYLEIKPRLIEKLDKLDLDQYGQLSQLESVIKTLKKLLESEQTEQKNKSKLLQFTSQLLEKIYSIEKDKIVKLDLSKEKITEFMESLSKEYTGLENKISNYCIYNSHTEQDDSTVYESINYCRKIRIPPMPKSYFIDQHHTYTDTSDVSTTLGRYIGELENSTLFEQIKTEVKHENCSRERFEKDIFSKWAEKDDEYVILTNDYDDISISLEQYSDDTTKEPKLYIIDWNEQLNPKIFYMLLKKEDITLDFQLPLHIKGSKRHKFVHHFKPIMYNIIDFDKDPEYKKHFIEKKQKFSCEELKAKVLTTICLCPKINEQKSKFENIEIYEITNNS